MILKNTVNKCEMLNKSIWIIIENSSLYHMPTAMQFPIASPELIV